MREFTKALFSYSLAMSLFGLKQIQNLITPTGRAEHRGPATKAFDSVTHATTDQFGGTMNSLFRMLDNVQRGLVSFTFSFFIPASGGSAGEDRQAEPRRSGLQWSSEPERSTQDTLYGQQPASTLASPYEDDAARRYEEIRVLRHH